jgi:hypothetical protein
MAKNTREPKHLEGIPSALETAWPVECRTVKF